MPLARTTASRATLAAPAVREQHLDTSLPISRSAHSLEFLVGFDVEFIMLGERGGGSGGDNSATEYFPLNRRGGLSTASGLRSDVFIYVEECVDALTAAGVPVLQFHSEGRAGQFELSLAPLPPMQAVDAMVAAHETIKNKLARHGHAATMYPKPFATLPANGSHFHLSLHRASDATSSTASAASPAFDRGDASASAIAEMTTTTADALAAVAEAAGYNESRAAVGAADAAHFLAGLLRRLPALCAFAAPCTTRTRVCSRWEPVAPSSGAARTATCPCARCTTRTGSSASWTAVPTRTPR